LLTEDLCAAPISARTSLCLRVEAVRAVARTFREFARSPTKFAVAARCRGFGL
jgi:hypothetical protein